MSILQIKNLSFSYKKEKTVLNDICLQIGQGEIFCLLGPNGCGKSTLISQILFPDYINRDKVCVYGKKYSEYSRKELSKILSFVPQKIPALQISVLQAVVMGKYPYKKDFFLRPTEEDYTEAVQVIQKLGLFDLKDRKLSTLSGGEIQRVFIAQALVKKANIFFFDEPMAALDPEYQSDFLRIITKLSNDGAAVIFTTHNPNHLFALDKVRAGIIDKEHKLYELDMASHDSVFKIEETFNNSVNIEYSEKHKKFVSVFEY